MILCCAAKRAATVANGMRAVRLPREGARRGANTGHARPLSHGAAPSERSQRGRCFPSPGSLRLEEEEEKRIPSACYIVSPFLSCSEKWPHVERSFLFPRLGELFIFMGFFLEIKINFGMQAIHFTLPVMNARKLKAPRSSAPALDRCRTQPQCPRVDGS